MNNQKLIKRSKIIVVEIITKFNLIEFQVKEIIAGFVQAKEDGFLRDILLNNMIVNFSSKTKALFYIINEKKIEFSDNEIKEFKKSLLILMSKRNIIAHSDSVLEPTYEITGWDVDYNKEGNLEFPDIEITQPIVSTLNNGKIEYSDIEKVYSDFSKYHEKAEKYLRKLKKELGIPERNIKW